MGAILTVCSRGSQRKAREAIIHAQDEAREMGHGPVQVEHLLVGLFSDHDGIAGRVLADFGLTIAPVRDLVRQRLGVGSTSVPGRTFGSHQRLRTPRGRRAV